MNTATSKAPPRTSGQPSHPGPLTELFEARSGSDRTHSSPLPEGRGVQIPLSGGESWDPVPFPRTSNRT